MIELEAVNTMLKAIGSQVVNSVNTEHPDVQNARRVIREVLVEAQQRGWWFNTEYNVTLYPDTNKEISVSSDVHAIQPTVGGSVVLRGKKLFNAETNTYKFDCNVVCNTLIRIMVWEEVPESLQAYIKYKAASSFVRDEIGDAQKAAAFTEDAKRAWTQVLADDLESRPVNALHSANALKMRSGVRPYGNSLRDQWWRR